MTITYYRTAMYHNVDQIEADEIFGNLEPEEMDDDTREQLQSGKAHPLCCFVDADGTAHCIPWDSIISIR